MTKPIDEHHHIRLSDLLLDAEVELKSIDMKSLAGAVRVARDRIVGTPHDEQVGHVPDVAMWPTLNTTPGEPILKPKNAWGVPEYDVACPECKAAVGKPCVNEGGGHLFDGHVPRMPAVHGSRCLELKIQKGGLRPSARIDRDADEERSPRATNWIVGRFAQAIYESRRRRIQSGKPIGEGESQAFETLDFEDTHENVRELYRIVARESLQSIVEHFPRTFATLATELGLAVPERDARDA